MVAGNSTTTTIFTVKIRAKGDMAFPHEDEIGEAIFAVLGAPEHEMYRVVSPDDITVTPLIKVRDEAIRIGESQMFAFADNDSIARRAVYDNPGSKIEAIRQYRAEVPSRPGLKEAKDVIDRIWPR